MYMCVQRNTTFTYCSNSRGSLSAPMTLVILFTLTIRYHQGLSKVPRNKSRVVFEPPWWFSEKFYATVTSIKKKNLIFRPSSYLTFPFVTHAFLHYLNCPLPARRYSIEGGEETMNEIIRKDGPLNL